MSGGIRPAEAIMRGIEAFAPYVSKIVPLIPDLVDALRRGVSPEELAATIRKAEKADYSFEKTNDARANLLPEK